MAGDGHSLEPGTDYGLQLLLVPGHSHAEKALRILPLNLRKVFILATVNQLLHHHGGAHLGVIHVGEEDLGRIPAVYQEGRQHLHFLVQEDAASVLQGQDALPVHPCVLLQPQMAVCIYYEFAHVTRC